MYILVVESINYNTDKFFIDTTEFNPSAMADLFLRIRQQNPNMFLNDSPQSNTERLSNPYTIKNSLFYFTTIEAAETYSKSIDDGSHPYRQLVRAWNKENNIISKFYITDSNHNIVKTLTDCEQQVCIRFGGQCSTESGCSTIEYATSLKNKKVIPLQQV